MAGAVLRMWQVQEQLFYETLVLNIHYAKM